MNSADSLLQRADYTQKYNHSAGRHGWLRLTPAYSVKIVDELLSAFPGKPSHVFDPFCGTGTTALCAASLGFDADTVEINPFLVWLTETKTANYSQAVIQAAREVCKETIAITRKPDLIPVAEPPIYNIDRWWSKPARDFLCRLRAAIEQTTIAGSPERSLLLIAFCRTLITLSNAAFNHQSMSFRTNSQIDLGFPADMPDMFRAHVSAILSDAMKTYDALTRVIHGDARVLSQLDDKFDLVITSPPYANRMSYIRELRPYMYWLGYLTNGREAGELDWQAIGGTWGIATSRLAAWKPDKNTFIPKWLARTLDAIAHTNNTNGRLLANYIAKYAEDMWRHFTSLANVMCPGGKIHYIVGNSVFYGTLLPTERLYSDMLAEIGFERIAARPIRKRNSKKELLEFDVSGSWK
ncbi:MAG: site-specific DNA-methyltransferase [Spirochaetota bacterium]|jgi:predicted methyltransferase|nr:site-specific DNA-methyltransferase [Spirochaetota bacterium]